MEERHLSLGEVAQLMGKSERTVRRWIKSGKLKAYKPGRDFLIPESAIRAFVEESEVHPKLQGRLPLEEVSRWGGQSHNERTAISTKDVVYAIDMMVGLRAEAPRYAAKWAKHLENLLEGGPLPEQAERELMLVANTMQDEFMRSFETIGQAALVEGRSTPYEWPQNIKDLVLEAGAHVQAAAETALRISEECARRSNTREKVLAEEFSVGQMPEGLTRDPAWNTALEEARAVR